MSGKGGEVVGRRILDRWRPSHLRRARAHRTTSCPARRRVRGRRVRPSAALAAAGGGATGHVLSAGMYSSTATTHIAIKLMFRIDVEGPTPPKGPRLRRMKCSEITAEWEWSLNTSSSASPGPRGSAGCPNGSCVRISLSSSVKRLTDVVQLLSEVLPKIKPFIVIHCHTG